MLLLFPVPVFVFCQSSTELDPDGRWPAGKVDEEAQFPGGPEAWGKYIDKIIRANIDSLKKDENSTVTRFVRFVVHKTGKVTDVREVHVTSSKLAELLIKAIQDGPDWMPAKARDGSIPSSYRIIPRTFNPDYYK